MTSYYKSIYTALRSSMIDRDEGDNIEDAILIDFKSASVALKPEIPSAALLIAYSMLYYPGWTSNLNPITNEPSELPIESFIGGVENPKFPLLYNPEVAMIAVAVGIYAGLYTVRYSPIVSTIMVKPTKDTALYIETQRRIKEDKLDYSNARSVFVELMKQEEYKGVICLADDFIANATFIEDASASVDTDANAQIEQAIEVDFSKDFGKVTKGEQDNG